jgi:hypothetical protein
MEESHDKDDDNEKQLGEFITWHSIESQFDGPIALLPCSLIPVPLSLQLGTGGWKPFFGLCEKSGVVGKSDVGGHVITTCGLLICQAQLFVAKAHYNIWTLAFAPGES